MAITEAFRMRIITHDILQRVQGCDCVSMKDLCEDLQISSADVRSAIWRLIDAQLVEFDDQSNVRVK